MLALNSPIRYTGHGLADHGLSISDMMRIAEAYRREMVRLQRAEPTIRIYSRGLQLLVDFARQEGIVNRETIRRWQDDLYGRLSGRSAALYGVSVRRMLTWAADNDECERGLANAIPPAKYNRYRLPRPLRPAHMATIEAYLRSRVDESPDVHALRDRALFYYVRATAARVGEVLQVRRDTFEHATVRQTQRSGGEKVLVPPPGVVDLIRQYLAARTDDLDCLWLAVKPNGETHPLADAGVCKIWERVADAAGVPRFTTYRLRHTAGALLAERGHDIVDIMVHFGARDTRAVQGYKELVTRNRIDEVRADLDVTSV
jgi:site-specific recombinase XerD